MQSFVKLVRFGPVPHHVAMDEAERGGQTAALQTQTVDFYRPALIQFFRRKARDQSEVEDLVQEVFLRIAARQATDVIDNLGGYIFQTAASVLADRYRRRAVRRADDHVEFDNERHAAADFDAARIVEARQLLRAAATALQSMPERTRTIFILRRLEGESYRDIAARFSISVSAVEKHMVRAAHHLLTTVGTE